MTHDEVHALALEFMIEHYGRPIALDAEARDQWYQTLGLLMHFANTLFKRVSTDRTTPTKEHT